MFKYFRGCTIYQTETDSAIIADDEDILVDKNIAYYGLPGRKSRIPNLGELDPECTIIGTSYFLAKKICYYHTDDGKTSFNFKGAPCSTLDKDYNDVQLIEERDYEVLANGDYVQYSFGSMNRQIDELEISNTIITRKICIDRPEFEGFPIISPTVNTIINAHKSYIRREELEINVR
jgi:hypothetical protein